MFHSRDLRVYIYSDASTTSQQWAKPERDNSETYRLHERWVLRHLSLIRWIVKSRHDFGDALGSKTRSRPILSTIATSRKTTPTDNRQEEIAYDLLQRAQLHSTAVDWAAQSDAESAIDENDYITPERLRLTRTQRGVTRRRYCSQHGYIARSCALAFPFPGVYLSQSMCAYEGEAVCERIPPTETTTRWKSTYVWEAIRRRSWLTMRMKILLSDTRCPSTISANTHRNDRVSYKEEDAFLQIHTTEVDPGRANSQLILRYYIDHQPFSLSRWQSGVPMILTGGPQIPRLLDLEAIYTSKITCARVRKMHAIYTFSSYGSSWELVVDNNPRRLDAIDCWSSRPCKDNSGLSSRQPTGIVLERALATMCGACYGLLFWSQLIRIARAAVEWNHRGYTSDVVTIVGWMSEQRAAAVVAVEERPHGILEWLLLARRGTKGVTRRQGLVHSWANR